MVSVFVCIYNLIFRCTKEVGHNGLHSLFAWHVSKLDTGMGDAKMSIATGLWCLSVRALVRVGTSFWGHQQENFLLPSPSLLAKWICCSWRSFLVNWIFTFRYAVCMTLFLTPIRGILNIERDRYLLSLLRTSYSAHHIYLSALSAILSWYDGNQVRDGHLDLDPEIYMQELVSTAS